jgi:hypothetical protein
VHLSEVSSTHTPPAPLSRHGAFWWLLQVAVFAALAFIARMVDSEPAVGFDEAAPFAQQFAAESCTTPMGMSCTPFFNTTSTH